VSVDETMFLFKGLADGKKRRIVGKPISTGLKLWIIVDENEIPLYWWLDGSVHGDDFPVEGTPISDAFGEIVTKLVSKLTEDYPSKRNALQSDDNRNTLCCVCRCTLWK
jgi:hypothetical protein